MLAEDYIGYPPLQKVIACFKGHSKRNDKMRNIAQVAYTHGDPVVHIEKAIDEEDISHIKALSYCIQEFDPGHFEYRPFDLGASAYGGGNNVTYTGGYFQIILPGLMSHLMDIFIMATENAGWRPYPGHLGVRCVETLDYGTGGELLWHVDSGSIYTFVAMMASPSDFEGGSFVIQDRRKGINPKNKTYDSLRVDLDRGDAMIFDSTIDHGVDPIKRGVRTVLVFELWPYEDIKPHEFRPSPGPYFGKNVKPRLVMVNQGRSVPGHNKVLSSHSLIAIDSLVGFVLGIGVAVMIMSVWASRAVAFQSPMKCKDD